MKCTEKEQLTCNVEKMGCEGCAYNDKTADEIKVGEWIRTFNGEIGKIIKIKNDDEYSYDYYICDNDKATSLKSMILRHSPNIIDLIEVRRLCKWI